MINEEKFQTLKKEYLSLLGKVNRDGIDQLIQFLEKSDFFDAPSSAKYHSAYKHGLLEHSLNVYHNLIKVRELFDSEHQINDESLIVVALLHDLCKTGFYKIELANRKIDGIWKQVETYAYNDRFPCGHGEKSVIMVQRFIKLTSEEIMAVCWHMGGFDIRCMDYQGRTAISTAMEKYKLVCLIQMADMAATFFDETRKGD